MNVWVAMVAIIDAFVVRKRLFGFVSRVLVGWLGVLMVVVTCLEVVLKVVMTRSLLRICSMVLFLVGIW